MIIDIYLYRNQMVKNLSIYFACLGGCLSVWVFVCLYPIKVKTAELIGPKFFVGPHVIPVKVYESSEFKKFVFKSFFIFVKF